VVFKVSEQRHASESVRVLVCISVGYQIAWPARFAQLTQFSFIPFVCWLARCKLQATLIVSRRVCLCLSVCMSVCPQL